MTVLVAPDSFKGSMDAAAAAAAIGAGWSTTRPEDRVVSIPQADGGEGTAAAIARSVDGAVWRSAGRVTGPDGRGVEGRWLELPGGTAVVELAQMSGITLMERLDPDRATTRGFGEVIRRALVAGARRLVLCLGGSASNDGGAGVLAALGCRLLDGRGYEVADGAAGLETLASVDAQSAVAPPALGVVVLSDVTSPLLGPTGASAVFGPQKGIGADRLAEFDRRLARLAEVGGRNPGAVGMGAAGGTAYGLSTLWPISITPGARAVAEMSGLAALAGEADVMITGEGRFDAQSLAGKVVGNAIELARRNCLMVGIVAGALDAPPPGAAVDLVSLAGSPAEAMAHPERYAKRAGAVLASRQCGHGGAVAEAEDGPEPARTNMGGS